MKINRRLVPSFLASASWEIYWIMIIYSVNATGNVRLSLFLSMIFSIAVLLIFLSIFNKDVTTAARKHHAAYGRDAIMTVSLLAVLGGLANGLGDTMFGVVAFYKIAAIGSAISAALSLVLVALLAYFLYKDRMTKTQKLGFVVLFVIVVLH